MVSCALTNDKSKMLNVKSKMILLKIQILTENCITVIYYGDKKTSIISFGPIWDNNWNHLVFIVNTVSSKVSGYLNSNFVQEEHTHTSISTANSVDFYIGKTPVHNNFFKGYIDNISIYNRALTEKEIQALYNDKN